MLKIIGGQNRQPPPLYSPGEKKGKLTNGNAPVLVGRAALDVVDELSAATAVGAQDPSFSKYT